MFLLKRGVVGLFVGAGLMAGGVQAKEGKAKNVLFIFADDLGYKDLGFTGSSFYDTPHLDELAKQSVIMDNAYAACPVCSPTRSSVMSGQYPARTKNTEYFGAYNHKPGNKIPGRYKKLPVVPASYVNGLPHKLTVLPEALRENGFNTFFAGKWHLGLKGSWPQDHGFDVNIGGHSGGGPYGGKKYFSPYNNPSMENGPAGEHLPDRLATETVDFIKKTDKRFFAMLSFYSVHTPLIGRDDLVKKYEKKAEAMGYAKGSVFKEEFPRKVRVKQNHAVYGAMIEAMDEAVGKVIKGLKESGKYEETMIIFFSDNGGLSTSEGSPTSNQPLRAGKGWLYEGGIKEPTLLKVPGVTKGGSNCSQLMTSTDFYPTILAACGLAAKPDEHKDGINVLPYLNGELKDRSVFWHYPHWGNQGGSPGSVVREGDWKFIRYYTGKKSELFNLKNDQGEKNNLAEKNFAKVKEMSINLDAFLKDTKANMPFKNPHYKGSEVNGKKVKW